MLKAEARMRTRTRTKTRVKTRVKTRARTTLGGHQTDGRMQVILRATLKEIQMRLILINIVRLLCRLYGKFTELFGWILQKSGRILLAEGSFESRLRIPHGMLQHKACCPHRTPRQCFKVSSCSHPHRLEMSTIPDPPSSHSFMPLV